MEKTNVEKERKVTLYNKLNAIGNKIPLNGLVEGLSSFYEPKEDYYVEDEGITRSIKRKVIEPFESNPVVSDLINKKSTILERIRPIVSRADEVKGEYEQIKWIKRFDPEKEIFRENENLIADELVDILDIKKPYKKSFIVSKKFNKIADKLYGIDMEEKYGNLRPLLINLRNALPIASAAVYFVEPSLDLGLVVEKYPIIGDLAIGLFAELVGTMASGISSLLFIHEGSDKIGKETERLKKQAQFLDETITELYK